MTSSTHPIRVLLCDDHAIVRKGISALLSTEPHIRVAAGASDGAEAVAQAKALNPDVILMDLVMPRLDGIEATRRITAHNPNAHILVLTSFAADDKVTHHLDPMVSVLRIEHQDGSFAALFHVARFFGCRRRIDPHIRPIKITPDRDGVRLPIGVNRAEHAKNRTFQ
jgi:CheY-like chemotaxis protein